MPKQILENVRIFAGGCDLTGQSNKIGLEAEHEEKDVTNFGSIDANNKIWKEVLGGLGSAKIDGAGQWEAGDTSKVDDDMFAALGGLSGWSIAANNSANVGETAYLVNGLRSKYQFGGQVGDVAMWSSYCASTWPAARGAFLHPPGTARTATGNGTAVQIGAVTAGKYMYAAAHILSVSGTSTPTITLKLQSDDNSGMTTPTDRLTFTAATARSGEILRVAGAITDDWWRIVWTISGTTPSFLFVASAGIK